MATSYVVKEGNKHIDYLCGAEIVHVWSYPKNGDVVEMASGAMLWVRAPKTGHLSSKKIY